jgi:hypothetical protein
MVSLTADDTVLLKDVSLYVEPVEVYDSAGKLLGLFVPANLERGKEMYARAEARIDWAEIERRKKSNEKGATLQEFWGRIKTLEAEMERRKAAGEKEFTHEEAVAYFKSLRKEGAQAGDSLGKNPAP